MHWKDTQKIFGIFSIFLHWVTAVSVLVLLATGLVSLYYLWFATGARGGIGWFDMNLHVALGSISIPFIIARVWWRVAEGHPEEPRQHPFLEKLTALNWPIMLVLIVVCFITGVYLVLLHGNSLEWFGRIPLHEPIYPKWVPQMNEFHTAVILPIHIWASIALGGIIAVHIAGALKHWIVDGDGVLERILRPGELRGQAETDAAPHSPQSAMIDTTRASL